MTGKRDGWRLVLNVLMALHQGFLAMRHPQGLPVHDFRTSPTDPAPKKRSVQQALSRRSMCLANFLLRFCANIRTRPRHSWGKHEGRMRVPAVSRNRGRVQSPPREVLVGIVIRPFWSPSRTGKPASSHVAFDLVPAASSQCPLPLQCFVSAHP
jgi:hypothetical protein